MRVARMGFIDSIGTMIAGRNEDSVRILTEVLAPADGPATLTFGARKAPHPRPRGSTVPRRMRWTTTTSRCAAIRPPCWCPAILAEAEALGSSGADMITAYVAGYEIWAELFRARHRAAAPKRLAPDRPVRRGRRRGSVRQTAQAGRREDGDRHRARRLAVAGLMSNFGTMTKPFHAGKSAHAGIMAARLAEAGFTANTDALEHPQGFLHAISPTGNEDRTSEPKAGREWAILTQGLGIKKYPDVLLHASRHRLHAGPGGEQPDQGRRGEENHRQHQRLFRHGAAQPRSRTPASPRNSAWSSRWRAASSRKRVGLRELTDDVRAAARHAGADAKVEIVTTTEYDPEHAGRRAARSRWRSNSATAGRSKARRSRRATGHPTPAADRRAALRQVRRLPGCGRLGDPGGRAVRAGCRRSSRSPRGN